MDTLSVGTDELTFRVTSAQSDGALLAVEVRLPAGGGPPAAAPPCGGRGLPRRARRAGDLPRGRRAIAAIAAGSVVHIPGGRAHTVRNESDADAHAYVVFTPGTEIEHFFRAAGGLAAPGPAEVMALAERHGIEML